jgi:hypothetical protein
MEPFTDEEIERVAEAMWGYGNCGDRPTWKQLLPIIDDDVKAEFRGQARAGIREYLRLRAKAR